MSEFSQMIRDREVFHSCSRCCRVNTPSASHQNLEQKPKHMSSFGFSFRFYTKQKCFRTDLRHAEASFAFRSGRRTAGRFWSRAGSFPPILPAKRRCCQDVGINEESSQRLCDLSRLLPGRPTSRCASVHRNPSSRCILKSHSSVKWSVCFSFEMNLD